MTADPCAHKDLASSAQSAAIGLHKSNLAKRTQEQISHHPQVLPRTITAPDRLHLVVHGCLAAWLHGLLAAWPHGRMATDRTSAKSSPPPGRQRREKPLSFPKLSMGRRGGSPGSTAVCAPIGAVSSPPQADGDHAAARRRAGDKGCITRART